MTRTKLLIFVSWDTGVTAVLDTLEARVENRLKSMDEEWKNWEIETAHTSSATKLTPGGDNQVIHVTTVVARQTISPDAKVWAKVGESTRRHIKERDEKERNRRWWQVWKFL